MPTSALPPRFSSVLEPWCAVGATGALRAVDPPGGAVFLVDGRLVYAESPHAVGVDRLLTASGRLPAETWRAALAAGRGNRRVGDILVEQEHLTGAELELVTSAALLDAALFLFDATVPAQFEAGAGHLIGTGCALEFHDVCQELDRRRRLLDGAWPDPEIDTVPVVPARRLAGHHVGLTAVQWEIVANADRRRTPGDLARLLGRETFVMRLEVRRLAQAGLVTANPPANQTATGTATVPRQAAAAEATTATRARGRAVTVPVGDAETTGRRRRRAPEPPPTQGEPPSGRSGAGVPPPGRTAPDKPAEREEVPRRAPPDDVPPLLPRRTDVERPWAAAPAEGPEPDPAGYSTGTLMRIRRALDALR
ncbi:hypothetical protein Val02_67850 [Virgisporangium aliadipatigenens]|uniref:DUF4388 domain-containing protein n=1 Tax=Virgisporangium aliadipatigenens TaxID=741659 RepID=A0A8J4DTL7_9ACTN|nr:hypothetical protein Val02_67850 [Virgisporangium aliadipatigenens]